MNEVYSMSCSRKILAAKLLLVWCLDFTFNVIGCHVTKIEYRFVEISWLF